MSNTIRLESTSILHVPIRNYEPDFSFIVNNKKFETSRLVADLLSPKISKYHLSDPTINEYQINTTNKGNFNTILNLIKFNDNSIQEDELPFIIEVIENLETTTKTITINTETKNEEELSISDTIQQLQKHHKFPHFYSDQITKEIEKISENLYQASQEDKENIFTFDIQTISKIIHNSKLQIESEDELVDLINELYKKEHKYSELYSEVLFCNVSQEKMKEFIDTVFYGDINEEVWESLSKRLSSDIIKSESDESESAKRYKKMKPVRKPVKTLLYNNKEFEGLIKYFQTEKNIKDEIELSRNEGSKNDIWRILDHKNTSQTNTGVNDNAWICIGFKNNEINPTHYTIRSGYDSDNLKSFVIEGSKDKSQWTKLDEENNISYLQQNGSVHTFPIHNETHQSFKYLRIRLTGPNWYNRSLLQLSSIDFYGEL